MRKNVNGQLCGRSKATNHTSAADYIQVYSTPVLGNTCTRLDPVIRKIKVINKPVHWAKMDSCKLVLNLSMKNNDKQYSLTTIFRDDGETSQISVNSDSDDISGEVLVVKNKQH